MGGKPLRAALRHFGTFVPPLTLASGNKSIKEKGVNIEYFHVAVVIFIISDCFLY